MNKPTTTYSVIVPLYNCGETVGPLVDGLVSFFSRSGLNLEIILVDDNDPTNSWDEVLRLSKELPCIVGLRLSRNFGQHAAILAGLERAKGNYIIVMDGDLQDSPDEIGKLLPEMEKGFDAIFARRLSRQDPFLKRTSSEIFYMLLSILTGIHLDPKIANFGIYNKKFIRAILSMKDQVRFFPVMIRWVGFKVGYVDVEHQERGSGKSGYNIIKLLRLGINIALSFSEKPLFMVLGFGLVISALSFGAGVVVIVLAALGVFSVVGWASLFVSIWFLSGVIITVVGTVGLYVGKIYNQVKMRPIYLIAETTFDE